MPSYYLKEDYIMRKFKGNIVIILVILFALLLTACVMQASSPKPESESDNPAVIWDRTGRSWDVTHARDVYGMNPDFYNYGLGVGAIPSVDNPKILEEGDRSKPRREAERKS